MAQMILTFFLAKFECISKEKQTCDTLTLRISTTGKNSNGFSFTKKWSATWSSWSEHWLWWLRCIHFDIFNS